MPNSPDILFMVVPCGDCWAVVLGCDQLSKHPTEEHAREAAARGQTVFLSSHILDEVEDLCDRVGILRSGKLVEVATLEDLRRLHTTVVEVVLDGPVPDFAGVPGVTDVDLIPSGARLSVTGSPRPLLALLATLPVARLRTEEPSLEEIFLTYY